MGEETGGGAVTVAGDTVLVGGARLGGGVVRDGGLGCGDGQVGAAETQGGSRNDGNQRSCEMPRGIPFVGLFRVFCCTNSMR